MTINRVLVLAAVACFGLTALSAFSGEVNLTEMGWLALGLAAWAGSALAVGSPLALGRTRSRALR